MTTVFDFLAKGGPVMIPILAASVLTFACALERAQFWSQLLRREGQIVHDVLEKATRDLDEAAMIAARDRDLPISRFLLAPLSLKRPSPESFRLALETAAEREFVKMRKGDKLLETVVAVSPLLGLLGTVTGLIATFSSLNIGGGGGTEEATRAAEGIGEALITTAAGMVVAIVALHDVVALAAQHRVVARAARHPVGAPAAVEAIIAIAAAQQVETRLAQQRVVIGAAPQDVVAHTAAHARGAGPIDQDVVAVAAGGDLDRTDEEFRPELYQVVARAAVQRVHAVAAPERVVSVRSDHPVVSSPREIV
ncbi:MotA/TolQ/ExbB proton channel family protein, partial [Romeria aff. gracilis LEGE 07310]